MRSERNGRNRLEAELQGSAYQSLLQTLRCAHPFFRQFRTWADVIAFMRSGTSRDPGKDEVLRPIFQAHGEDQDPRWRAALLAIFWPSLESICRRKRHWDTDQDELWQNLTWTFLQVLCRMDAKRRPDRLVQKVINDTIHHLYDEYRRIWNRTDREVTADLVELEALAGGVEDINFAAFELRDAQEKEVRHLRAHLLAGRIKEADFFLLVGTRIYGRSVADYARESGLDYQTAKKRRQRAEVAIRRFERKCW